MKFGIVAHVSRAQHVDELADIVGAHVVSYDDGALGCRKNHYHVWSRLAAMLGDDEWGVVFEDDAVPYTADMPRPYGGGVFKPQIRQALAVAPTDVVSLYLGQLRPPQWQRFIGQAVTRAEADEASWIEGKVMLHAVGVAIRGRVLVEEMLRVTRDFRRPIDEAISMWARLYDRPIAYTWPSLVDHADGPTVERHVDGEARESGRVAWKVGMRPVWTERKVALQQ